jgi:hypothetical protein
MSLIKEILNILSKNVINKRNFQLNDKMKEINLNNSLTECYNIIHNLNNSIFIPMNIIVPSY